jgi:hypothetical protein
VTLEDLYELANLWCPKKARWAHLLEHADTWGPAHELGHALIETSDRWRKESYGHCAIAFCECPRHLCDTYEIAAMRISSRLLAACGHPGLAHQEFDETSDIDLVDPIHEKRATALLRRKKLWPVPRTRRTLEAALVRRLGKPQGSKPKPPKPPSIRGSVGLGMFAHLLFNPGML